MRCLVLEAKFDPKPDYILTEAEKQIKKVISGSEVWRYPKLELKEKKTPKLTAADEVLIKVKACGVCGSDIHFYETDEKGYILYPGLTKFPCVLGHEFAGEIVEVGKEVKDFKIGDMVCAEEMIWCGYCRACRDGYPNQCENLEEIGFTIDGAFSEYIKIGAKYCWKIDTLVEYYKDKEKAYEAGACVEPTSVAYNAIFECASGFKPGAYVVVYGCGPIGLMAIALCKAAGAAKIIAAEISKNRRALAKKLGADYVYDPTKVENQKELILELTDGKGAELHIEAAGAPDKVITIAQETLSIGSKIVQIGRATQRVPMYLEVFQTKKAKVFGAQGHSGYGTFPNVIRLIAAGRIDPLKMITARYNLKDVVEAIKKSGKREDGKIIVKF